MEFHAADLGLGNYHPCNHWLFRLPILLYQTEPQMGISKMKSLRHIDDVLLKNRRIREVKRCINYGLVFLLTWCFLFFYEVLSDNFWLFLAKLFVWGCLSVLLLCIHPHNYIINNIHILLPRLVASITTAWVMLVIGNDLVKEPCGS